MASIRDKGRCPCPKCLTPLKEVEKLGTVQDMKQRKTLARLDDTIKQDKISRARDLIYKHNLAVDTADVEKLLNKESLVPTNVCHALQYRPSESYADQ